MPQVAILGAGISGLSLAYYLKKKFKDQIDITLIEKDNRVGGLIRSDYQEGQIIEWGPKSLRAFGKGQYTKELVDELGLTIKELSPKTKSRFLLVNKKLKRVPSFFFLRKFLFGCFKDIVFSSRSKKEETIAAFFLRHFGKSFTEQFVDPFIKGIFAGDIDKLSINACLPHFCELEKKHRSLVLGLKKSASKEKKTPYSFEKGLQELPDALLKNLEANVLLQTKVISIKQEADHKLTLFLEGADKKTFDFVFSALPANCLKFLDLGIKTFEAIEFLDIQVITLSFNKKLLIQDGFGYLVPKKEEEKILGAVFDSCLFDYSKTQITVMAKKEISLQEAIEAVKRHLNIKEEPNDIFHVTSNLPQYTLGHLDRTKMMEQELKSKMPRLKIIGSSFYGVSINDCIYEAKKVAESFELFS
jgi:oxygen-dependent protoporphyrinogen oxidase